MIQKRANFGGSRQNFTLGWNDYKNGFGDLNKEFWFGNEYIHLLTKSTDMKLRVELVGPDSIKAFAEYDNFW